MNNARYEVGDGWVCGFREEAERDGELDFVRCCKSARGMSAEDAANKRARSNR